MRAVGARPANGAQKRSAQTRTIFRLPFFTWRSRSDKRFRWLVPQELTEGIPLLRKRWTSRLEPYGLTMMFFETRDKTPRRFKSCRLDGATIGTVASAASPDVILIPFRRNWTLGHSCGGSQSIPRF